MAEVSAYIGYDDKSLPALILYRKINGADSKKVYVKLCDAWMFSEDHNPRFEEHIMRVSQSLYEYLCIDDLLLVSGHTRSKRMAEIAGLVESGIDELLKLPPQKKSSGRDKSIGEMRATLNGQNMNFEMTESGELRA